MPGQPSPTDIIDQLFQSKTPGNIVQIFLNTYTFCKVNWNRAYNLFQEEHNELEYELKTGLLCKMAGMNRPVFRLKNAIPNTSHDQLLVSTFALLDALAVHIAETYGATLSRYTQPFSTFSGEPFYLAPSEPNQLIKRIPSHKLPRRKEQLSASFLDYHDALLVTPGRVGEWELVRICGDRGLENLFAARLKRRRFRVAISSLSEKADIILESGQGGFHLKSIGPFEEQLTALKAVLNDAKVKGASILVLPELRMPPPLLSATKDFLRQQQVDHEHGLLLVVAGSWHVKNAEGHRFNRCVVLDHYGRELWTHDKLREYVITAENVKKSPGEYRKIGIGMSGASESIHRGLRLEFYDSSIGRLSAAICVGFFSQEVEPLLQASGASVFLVPSMTPSIVDLEVRANALVRSQHAFTFVANCGHVGPKARSFYQLPIKNDHPHRLSRSQRVLVFDLREIT